MNPARLRPAFSRDYATAARAYAFDLLASAFLFVGASLMAGRVWRFPFDDEIYTLNMLERTSAIDFLTIYPAFNDVHPPLSYLVFDGLHHLGLSVAGMRLCSLAMTALALALFQFLTLTFIAQRNGEPASLAARIVAVLLFSLSAMALGQGDALRWYPMFAMLIALFVTFYVAGDNDAARLCSAVPLGLAASTNFLTAFVILPFVLYRYGLQRRFRVAFDGVYWLVVAGAGSLGLYSAYSLVFRRAGMMTSQFIGNIAQAAVSDVLGFFGGDALGVSQAWIIVPVVAISALAMVSAIDRKRPDDPVHLLVMMLAAATLLVPAGFGKPRSFLYLAPVMAALLTLFIDRQARQRSAAVAVMLVALVVAPSLATLANINGGTHPFKRNSAIPYQSIVDFIQLNGSGSELVISSDPVLPWVLQHDFVRANRCVTYRMAEGGCVAARRYDSIFLITGYSDRSSNAAYMAKFKSVLDGLTAGRQKVATIYAGVDKDAALKSRFTGTPLSQNILTVDLYR